MGTVGVTGLGDNVYGCNTNKAYFAAHADINYCSLQTAHCELIIPLHPVLFLICTGLMLTGLYFIIAKVVS